MSHNWRVTHRKEEQARNREYNRTHRSICNKADKKYKHEHPEVVAYANAKQRCTNPNKWNYKNYGGRGIQFKFNSFEEFEAELGPRPSGKSLDRYPDNDGHYEPGNVRWATPKEQRSNQRPRSCKEAA